MKKKNKKIAVISIAAILTVAGVGSLLFSNKLGRSPSKEENSLKSNQTLAMYVEGDDGYELSTSKTFPTKGYKLNTEKSTCKNGGTISQDPVTKALSVSVSHADQCSVYFDRILLLEQIITSSNGVRTDFDEPATTDEGIFEMEDDYGTSYYYRGAVENNYVKFGQNSAGQDMYWRIIRLNGDRSLRIMYTGTEAYPNGTNNNDMFIGTYPWSSKYSDDAKYLGWMYGGVTGEASSSKEQAQTNETNSGIKTFVDNWYKTNIEKTGYANAVGDVLFCNDRTTPGSSVSEWPNDTGLGYGDNKTTYGAFGRLQTFKGSTSIVYWRTNIKPTFKCPEKNDAFTVDDTTKGNGALTYPVGLITVDEVKAAGIGSNCYLNRASRYWTLSPSEYSAELSEIYEVSGGSISTTRILASGVVRVAPVINLSSKYVEKMVGEGTIESPYEIGQL